MKIKQLKEYLSIDSSYHIHRLVEDGKIAKLGYNDYRIIDEAYFKTFNLADYIKELKDRHRANLSSNKIAYLATEQGKKAYIERVKKQWQNPETILKHSLANKAAWQRLSEEEKLLRKKSISLATKKWYEENCRNSKYLLTLKEAMNRPEVLQHSKEIRKTEEFKKKLSFSLRQAYSNPETKHKLSCSIRQAYRLKHDSGYYQSKEWKELSKSIQAKIYATKKRNKTFNSSRQAEECKQYLRQLGFVIEEEKPYPDEPNMHCDIYMPIFDLWIELHFSQLHGNEPYDEVKHKDELTELKAKADSHPLTSHNTNQYYRQIYNWTDLDVRKRNNAKRHNLNFKEIYDYSDFYPFVDNFLIGGKA